MGNNNTMQYSNVYENKIKEYLYTEQSSSQASQKALPVGGSFTNGGAANAQAKRSTNLGIRP